MTDRSKEIDEEMIRDRAYQRGYRDGMLRAAALCLCRKAVLERLYDKEDPPQVKLGIQQEYDAIDLMEREIRAAAKEDK